MQNQGNPSNNFLDSNNEPKFDFALFRAKVKNDWWVFLLSLAFCGLVGYLIMRYVTPKYYINAEVLIQDQSGGSDGGVGGASVGVDLSSLFGLKSNVDNEVAVLSSETLMGSVVQDMNLNIIYYDKGKIRNDELFKSPFTLTISNPKDTIQTTEFDVKLKQNDFDVIYTENSTGNTKHKKVKYNQNFHVSGVGDVSIKLNPEIPVAHGGEYVCDVTSIDNMSTKLETALIVSVADKQTTVASLNLSYPVPAKGEAILNKLISVYEQNDINDKDIIADSTIAFINNRLVIVSKELSGIESDIQKFQEKSKLADVAEQSKELIAYTNQSLDDASKVAVQISVINELIDYLKDDKTNNRIVPQSLLPQDPTSVLLIQRYDGFIADRDKLLLSSTEDNPYVQSLEQQIAALRKDLLTNFQNTKKTLVINKQMLDKKNGTYNQQIETAPGLERTYIDLSREQQVKQALYIFLLQKREETEISKTSNLQSARIIETPKADYLPYTPKVVIVFGLAFILGISFPFGRIYVKDLLNTRIDSKDDIQMHTTVPIIGEIGHNKTDLNLVITKDSRSKISEEFRVLRTNLQFFLDTEKKCNILMLTSSSSGEGKSFTALNLGAVLALLGKKVLLMEVDLRKPTISIKIGKDNSLGFTNYIISNEVKPEDIISPSFFDENLSILSSGPVSPNPTETILSERTTTLINYLKTQFDYIIIDAPPVGLVTDAQLLSKYADLTLYVVRQRFTIKKQLNIVNDLYKDGKISKIAILVNDIQSNDGYGYYGYGYGYGYYEQDAKTSFADKVKGIFSRK